MNELSTVIIGSLRRNDDSIIKQALQCSGHVHKATEEEGDQGILGKEIWRKKCGQQDTSTAGGRWRWQHKTELGGDKWSVAYMFHRQRQSSKSAAHWFIYGCKL